MSPRGRHAAGAACPGDEPWARTSDRAVWRAYERGLVLTVTRLAGGRWQATVEGPSVVERSPMPFRTRKRVMRRLKIGARVVIADGVHRELGPAT